MNVNPEVLDCGRHQKEFKVLVASRNSGAIQQMENILQAVPEASVSRNHICNGHSDPLYGLPEMPDMLIFWVGQDWKLELTELMAREASERPPLMICADHDDPYLMRLAMKSGAVDFLVPPIIADEMIAAIYAVHDELFKNSKALTGTITGVMNSKGGSGASFIACNIADLMAESSNLDVALVGLDIQFGSLSGYLDMKAKYGLLDALENIENIDNAALKGYMMQHPSGLHLLDAKPRDLLLPEDIDTQSLSQLMELLAHNYDQVVVDLPRHIDTVTSTVIERADKLLVIVQQGIAYLHDAKRILEILRRDLGVSEDRISVVVNRYERSHELSLQIMSKTLHHDNLLTIPNSFDYVNESINGGTPLYSVRKRASITKALLLMQEKLLGRESNAEGAMFNKLIHRLKVF